MGRGGPSRHRIRAHPAGAPNLFRVVASGTDGVSRIGNPDGAQERAVTRPDSDQRRVTRVDPTTTGGASALVRGVLLIRWPVLGWMLALAGFGIVEGRDPAVAVGTVALAATWVVWLTTRRGPWTTTVLIADLAIAGVLVVAGVRSPWLATIYPVTAPLTWGAVRGVRAGLLAGGVLGAASVVAALPSAAGWVVWDPALLRDPLYLLLAGGGMGFVAELLDRSAAQVRAAQAAELAASERAARLTERESIGRQIHDSVLQSLAMVHKRGRELADQPTVEGVHVAQLAELAGAQERVLRQLILRPPEAGGRPPGVRPLRERLERATTVCDGRVEASVTTVGSVELPAAHVEEVGAAVDQALANVLRHADARHVWLFAELDGAEVVVTVRDDGIGFTFDERALRAAGKYGLLRSIRGRVADLGGVVTVDTAPGRGTELELRVPVPTGVVDREVSGRE